MLTPIDDLLAHQIPETFDHVGTSDRNFFDRYYFNCHNLDGDLFLAFGMGLYPNLNVIDAFVSVVYDRKQHIVRASRLLDRNRLDTRVGPLSVQVVEGLQSLRVRCEPHEPGVAFDLLFTGVHFPYEEPRFNRRAHGRQVMDYLRMTQCGRWSGWLEVAGRRFELSPEGWLGARDHSWGVRSVGERELVGAGAASGSAPQFFWEWSPQQYSNRSLLYSLNEEADGRRWHQSAAFVYPYGDDRPPEQLSVAHFERLVPGTRRLQSVRLELRSGSGEQFDVVAEPLATLFMSGIGYGPPWRHGVYQGPIQVEGDLWDLDDPDVVKRVSGLTETLCRFRLNGQVGHGVFEFLCLGPYQPLGLQTGVSIAT